jgi:hypothetical protein
VLTNVEVGIADTQFRAITAGLNAADVVIAFPATTIGDGVRVVARSATP